MSSTAAHARPLSPSPSGQRPPASVSTTASSQSQRIDVRALDDRVRAPNPAKKATSTPSRDEIRDAATRDALRDQQSHPPPPLALPPRTTSIPSNMISSQRAAAPRADQNRPAAGMPRHGSIDSDVSSISTNTVTSQKPNGTGAARTSRDTGPQDATSLIAAAGSAEAAVHRLLRDKEHSDRQQAQLWRLVEKQRAMILGLNNDLEKSLKEKDRYRKKMKDSMQQSESAPTLTSLGRHTGELEARDDSQSPALIVERGPGHAATPASMRDIGLDSRKVSDSSDVTSIHPGRSDTPQDISTSTALPTTPQSASSIERPSVTTRKGPMPAPLDIKVTSTRALRGLLAVSPPISPRAFATTSPISAITATNHQKSLSADLAISPPGTAQSFSSSKQATRKAPPAPLQLSPPPSAAMNTIVDASDSEYEEDPDSARAEQLMRGRRRTREDDDREREAAAKEDFEHRSRSKKEKPSKSKPPSDQVEVRVDAPGFHPTEPLHDQRAVPTFQSIADPVAMLRQRAMADGIGSKNYAPALLSPGLPMSPRPGDRPMNSPMPRAPNKMMNTMPMSPKAGMMGMPLSPRAPRQPIPLPSQTPLATALNNPHLARAEAYQTSIADRLKVSPEPSPDEERPFMSNEPKTPGEVYTGFVTEQYPGLLLPPNALPSIYIKTFSPRMRPSRLSYIAPKTADENPVMTLAVHERSGNKQLWRVEKTYAALAMLDTHVRSICAFRDRLPDRTVFVGHAPAKIDARRTAVDLYLDKMLDCIVDEQAASVVCNFLSVDVIGAEAGGDYFGAPAEARPDTPVTSKQRPHRAGFLTKRGKNFGGWKARYFVLDGPNLRYFEAPGGAHLGVIKLQNAQIGKQSTSASQNAPEDEDNQFRHAFLVLEPKKKDSSSLVRHVLCAESDEERDLWVDALLAYVDYQDGDDDSAISVRGTQVSQPHISAARSPRLKQSFGDLRPPSRTKEKLEHTRGVSYNDLVAGEAPTIGTQSGSPITPQEATFPTPPSRPTISGPIDLTVIKNGEDWKGRAPPTPSTGAFPKDQQKKRGFFASTFTSTKGRSSSDLKEQIGSPTQDHHSHHGYKAVFGISLGEAVEYAHPAGILTDLPAVVYRCFEYLTVKNAIAEEGIFRLSGSNTVIKALKDRFNTEGDVNLVVDETYYDIHAVASLLKTYLRELPASILTRELHIEFLTCLEMQGREKIVALNILVNRLPLANRALLAALSAFLLSVVSNADVNKMNVRNGKSDPKRHLKVLSTDNHLVGIVFAPTLNVPGPLISSFVEDQHVIFGAPIEDPESPVSARDEHPQITSSDLRSPRKQMFTDLPTPAYNQTTFQSFGAAADNDTGFTPMQPSYANYQMAPQGDGGYGSLNDALRSPTVYNAAANGGTPTPRDVKSRRRESAMMLLSTNAGPQKKPSLSKLREEEGASF